MDRALPPMAFYGLLADSEKDPSAIIIELERGLRSGRAGDLCESLWFFSRLFTTKPFPVVINTTLLKLAELWRTSNNFVRANLLSVFAYCEGLFTPNNVLNSDEVMRRITAVLQSNDPLARALTLRALGSVALLVAERIDLQYLIHKCMESRLDEEFNAAIYATDKLLPLSETFANASVAKIIQAIEDLETLPATKLRLIRLFRHFHHNAELASRVLHECTRLLAIYPSREYVVVLLSAMTTVASSHPPSVPVVADVLASSIKDDPRRMVKLCALKQLGRLAHALPHHSLDFSAVTALLHPELSVPRAVQLEALRTLRRQSLSSTTLSRSAFADVLYFAQHPDVDVASAALRLLVHTSLLNSANDVHLEHTAVATVAFVMRESTNPVSLELIRSLLSELVRRYPPAANVVFSALTPLLTSAENGAANAVAALLLAVAELAPEAAHNHAPALIAACTRPCVTVPLPLYALVFKAQPSSLLPAFVRSPSASNWTLYQIGQQALCAGQFDIAADIFQSLLSKVESECFYFWLEALLNASRFESLLRTSTATSSSSLAVLLHLEQAQTALQAAMTSSAPMHFQQRVLTLRGMVSRMALNLLHLLANQPSSIFDASHQILEELLQQHSHAAREAADYADRTVRAFLRIDQHSAALLHRLSRSLFELAEVLGSNLPASTIRTHTTTLLVDRVCYPPFFFRMKFVPSVKMLASPHPRPIFDPHPTPFTVAFVIKISGLVSEDIIRRRDLRDTLLLVSVLDSSRQRTAQQRVVEPEQITASLRKGAFAATYRIQFPSASQSCSVSVNCQLKDSMERRWSPIEGELLFHFKNATTSTN